MTDASLQPATVREEWRLDWESDNQVRVMTNERITPAGSPGRFRHSVSVGHHHNLDDIRRVAEKRGGAGFTASRRTVTTTYGAWGEAEPTDHQRWRDEVAEAGDVEFRVVSGSEAAIRAGRPVR